MTKTTPILTMTPDFTPVVRMMAMQTRLAAQSSEAAMRLAYLPWKSWSVSFGALNLAATRDTVVAEKVIAKVAPKAAKKAEAPTAVEPKAKAVAPKVVAKAPKVKETPEVKETKAVAAPKPAKPVAEAVKPVEVKKVAPVAPKEAKKPAETKAAPAKAKPVAAKPTETKPLETKPSETKPVTAEVTSEKPALLKAARNGKADDLTQLKGVGPKLALALQEAGIYHYDQIAAWTEVQTLWVDDNIAGVRGRASRNAWVKQAQTLAKV
ncbi:MAG: hypothetical protein ACRBB0_07465 [Pelagimonas sp.]|uniref:hypothetical protein n=1 Tax=Pelagimonas sp. TaxID=2073170 RepID=UPI003D6C294F